MIDIKCQNSRHILSTEQRSVASGTLLYFATSAAIPTNYVREMISLPASFRVGTIRKHVKVATFKNGRRYKPSRQEMFRKVSSTIEQVIN